MPANGRVRPDGGATGGSRDSDAANGWSDDEVRPPDQLAMNGDWVNIIL